MRRKLLGTALTAVVLSAAVAGGFAYVRWKEPREQLSHVETRLAALRRRAIEPWPVGEGLTASVDANLVPTSEPLEALSERIGASDVRRDEWMRSSVPSHRLVEQLLGDADLRDEIGSFATGSHGEATDAPAERRDELLLWLVARAWAEDDPEACLRAAVDALRVAQATQRLLMSDRDIVLDDEMLVGLSLERPVAACGARATPELRRRAMDALLRVDGSRVWVGPPEILLEDFAGALAPLKVYVPFGDDPRRTDDLRSLGARLDELERYFDRTGPLSELELDRHGITFDRMRSHALSERYLRIQVRLLAGILLVQNGASLAPLGLGLDGGAYEVTENGVQAPTSEFDEGLQDAFARISMPANWRTARHVPLREADAPRVPQTLEGAVVVDPG